MSALPRDRSPISQRWIMDYCDQFVKAAEQFGEGAMREACLRRVECCMDLVDAWQLRNVPIEQRDKPR